MKILVVSPITHKHGQGIISTHVYDYLKDLNHVFLINTYTNGKFLSKFFINIVILFKILYYYIFVKFDKIYFTPSRNYQSSFRDLLILLLYNKNIVCHLHGSDLYQFLQRKNLYCKLLYSLYLIRNPIVIILSKSHSKYALGEFYNNYHIIPNFTSLSLSINNNANNFYFISIVNYGKGLDKSINYFQTIRTKNQVLKVIGWTLSDFTNTYGNNFNLNNVVFCGPVYDHHKIDSLISDCHTLIFLSRYVSEAQPLCVIEALINKRKVICSNWKMLVDFNDFQNVTIIDSKTNKEYSKDICLIPSDFFNKEFFNEKLLDAFNKR